MCLLVLLLFCRLCLGQWGLSNLAMLRKTWYSLHWSGRKVLMRNKCLEIQSYYPGLFRDFITASSSFFFELC